MASEFITLVDKDGNSLGRTEKLYAHKEGLLHSAISVCLFDEQGRMLLQRRADCKYHCGGQWANTCCGHPRFDEKPIDTANRRLSEELGISADISPLGNLQYYTSVGDGLIENEYVYLFVGKFKGGMSLNPNEVSEVAFIYPGKIRTDDRVANNLTPWFDIYLSRGAFG